MEQMGVFKHKEQKDRQASCFNRHPLGKSHKSLILGQTSQNAHQNEKQGLAS